MKRGETIQLLRELINRCSPTSIGHVSLIPPTPNNSSRGYELKIGTTPNTAFRESLMVLLKEKGLEMKEDEDFITIYEAKQLFFPCLGYFYTMQLECSQSTSL